ISLPQGCLFASSMPDRRHRRWRPGPSGWLWRQWPSPTFSIRWHWAPLFCWRVAYVSDAGSGSAKSPRPGRCDLSLRLWPLVRLLPGSAPIYWEDSVATPWFLLKRASYFTCDQGAGTLFSRETAVTYQDRYANFQKLQTLDFRQYSFCPLTDARRTTPLQRA